MLKKVLSSLQNYLWLLKDERAISWFGGFGHLIDI